MTDSSEWELSKENVQPLREGRKIAALTSALHHTPTDMQHLKAQRNLFEQQLRIYNGDDPLEIWDSYIKWTEQYFPSGGKDGKLLELLQRCLIHFQNHEEYKNDSRFVHIWIKFANFSDDPVEIYQHMFDQRIGCGLAMLYEEWASFVERLGNTRKADTIYLEGISLGAQPLDVLKLRHSEFQIRVTKGISLQPGEEEEEMLPLDHRTVLGGLRPDKKNRVGTTRTGTAKLGRTPGLGSVVPAPQQLPKPGYQMFQDENAPMFSVPQQTGEKRSIPIREQLNRENEQLPGVWTKAKVPQRKDVAAVAAMAVKSTFLVHEDENARKDYHTSAALVDSRVLSTKKTEKPGHLLDPVRNTVSRDERPMYCKEQVYCGTQEFSFEELRAPKYFDKKKKLQQEEEKRILEEQLREMRLIRDQVQKDLQSLRAEHRQLVEMKQMQLSSQESSGVQTSPMPIAVSGALPSAQSTPMFGAPPPLMSSSTSASFNTNAFNAPSFTFKAAPVPSASSPASSTSVLPAPSSASYSANMSSVPSSASFNQPALFSASFNSSLQRQGPGSHNASLNASQKTPCSSLLETSTSSGSGGRHPHHPPSTRRTPEANSSKHSLTGASPTINTKEALQMVQGMYNATLDCDKISGWDREETEMTAVQPPTSKPSSVVVFDESEQNAAKTPAVPTIFCDENIPPQENRAPASKTHKSRNLGSGGRMALQSRPTLVAHEFMAEDEGLGEGTEVYPHYDVTLAAVGSQESFAVAARVASTPFGIGRNNDVHLPSLQLSSIKPHKMARKNSDEEMTDAGSVQTNDSQAQHSDHAPFTFSHTGVTPKDLSPIIEGSSEGSTEDSKSHPGSTLGASSAVKTPAIPRQAPIIPEEDRLPVCSSDYHVIDTSHYVPAETDEKTEALLSMSVCIDPHNPFDEATIKNFLKQLNPPLSQREGYIQCNQHVPKFSACSFISMGMETYQLNRLIGEGGYAKVYLAENFISNMDGDDSYDTMDIDTDTTRFCVIKVQKPAAPWEFYICSELHKRLQKLGLDYMCTSMMEISHGYFYQDGSCLVSDYCPLGSLLSQVNELKKNRELMNNLEPLAAYLTVHLLGVVEALHACHIIHGDIKPDNILLTGLSALPSGGNREAYFGVGSQCLRLVDFGQAIDMCSYPPGTTFMAKVGTSGFQCIEMMTDRPWTYQTDMFGLAGSVHVLVFGQYMKVYCSQGHWNMTSSFQRKWNVDLWKKLFHQLLNIENCDQQPDLSSLRQEFEDHFMANLAPHFNSLLLRVRTVLGSASHKRHQ